MHPSRRRITAHEKTASFPTFKRISSVKDGGKEALQMSVGHSFFLGMILLKCMPEKWSLLSRVTCHSIDPKLNWNPVAWRSRFSSFFSLILQSNACSYEIKCFVVWQKLSKLILWKSWSTPNISTKVSAKQCADFEYVFRCEHILISFGWEKKFHPFSPSRAHNLIKLRDRNLINWINVLTLQTCNFAHGCSHMLCRLLRLAGYVCRLC